MSVELILAGAEEFLEVFRSFITRGADFLPIGVMLHGLAAQIGGFPAQAWAL